MIHLLADLSNYASAVIAVLSGIVYLSKPTFLSYHQTTADTKWEDIDPMMQTLILALMRVVGGCALAIGFVIAILQYQFSKSLQSWIPVTILVSGSFIITGILYAMFMVRIRTKERSPVALILITLVLLVVGYLLNNHLTKAI